MSSNKSNRISWIISVLGNNTTYSYDDDSQQRSMHDFWREKKISLIFLHQPPPKLGRHELLIKDKSESKSLGIVKAINVFNFIIPSYITPYTSSASS